MNERYKELYKSCRPKEALASQEQFQSADVLLGTEVEKFAQLIIQECAEAIRKDLKKFPADDLLWKCAMEESAEVVERHFGVNK